MSVRRIRVLLCSWLLLLALPTAIGAQDTDQPDQVFFLGRTQAPEQWTTLYRYTPETGAQPLSEPGNNVLAYEVNAEATHVAYITTNNQLVIAGIVEPSDRNIIPIASYDDVQLKTFDDAVWVVGSTSGNTTVTGFGLTSGLNLPDQFVNSESNLAVSFQPGGNWMLAAAFRTDDAVLGLRSLPFFQFGRFAITDSIASPPVWSPDPNENILAFATVGLSNNNAAIQLVDLNTPDTIVQYDLASDLLSSTIIDVSWSATGRYVTSDMFDPAQSQPLTIIDTDDNASSMHVLIEPELDFVDVVAWSSDDRYALLVDQSIQIDDGAQAASSLRYYATEQQQLFELGIPSDTTVYASAWQPNSSTLALVTQQEDQQLELLLLDVTANEIISRVATSSANFEQVSLRWSVDGDVIYMALPLPTGDSSTFETALLAYSLENEAITRLSPVGASVDPLNVQVH